MPPNATLPHSNMQHATRSINYNVLCVHSVYENLSPISSISSCISLNYESLLADMVTAVLRSGSQPSGLNYLGKGNNLA